MTRRLAKVKNAVRSETGVSKPFLAAVRAHNHSLRAVRQTLRMKSARQQEKSFRNNPWTFAKSVCEGFDARVAPQFSADSALNYFSATCSNHSSHYESLPSWISEVMPLEDPVEEFDMTPIVPKMIKKILQKCSPSSSPGSDVITYLHLRKLPSSHHFLATLYSKIIFESQMPPPSWCVGKLALIYKSGSANDPANFRPTALTSVVGKRFHKIIARRLESYLILNYIIDTSVQKDSCPE